MGRHAPGRRTTSQSGGSFHPIFHFPRDASGRHATPRDTMWLMLLNFRNVVEGEENTAKVEVVSSNLISRSAPFYGAPEGSVFAEPFSFQQVPNSRCIRQAARPVRSGAQASERAAKVEVVRECCLHRLHNQSHIARHHAQWAIPVACFVWTSEANARLA